MSKVECDIRIGTSGWHYQHWSGPFYPKGLPKTKWLEHYTAHFNTVEINNTFYQLPKEQTFENWQKQAPEHFLFTVKANRYITHIKRLKDTAEEINRFLDRTRLLKTKLGPILYQLPPNLKCNIELLESFIKLLPKKHIRVFEFRHESWFQPDIYDLLKKHNATFCIHDMPGKPSPRIITSDVIYIRFHGPDGKYSGDYSNKMLKDWAEWIKQNSSQAKIVFAYFNNDIQGHAIKNAKQLIKELKE